MKDSTPYFGSQAASPSGAETAGAALIWGVILSIWPYRTIRIFLAAVFLWSGATKLIHPKTFAVIIEAYGMLPDTWVIPVAVALPVMEVVAALGLVMDIRGSLAIVAVLLILFMSILGYGIWMGLDIDCGCFGPQDPEADAFHSLRPALYRDMIMMAGVLYLYAWRCCRGAELVRPGLLFKNKSRKEKG